MQSLERLDVLKTWPLPGFNAFVAQCRARAVREVNVTGTNTDPLLFENLEALVETLRREGFATGLRTNAATRLDRISLFDKVSVSIHSFDLAIYRAIMGSGAPPNIHTVVAHAKRLKLNVVLCPENGGNDLLRTIEHAVGAGVRTINLREPYGQPHIGNPMNTVGGKPSVLRFGMPVYEWGDAEITYWDVHYVEVESVNLYASGLVSETSAAGVSLPDESDPLTGKMLFLLTPQQAQADAAVLQQAGNSASPTAAAPPDVAPSASAASAGPSA